MVGEQQTLGKTVLHRGEEPGQQRGLVEVRRNRSQLRIDLRQRRSTQPVLAATEIDQQQQRIRRIAIDLRRDAQPHVRNRSKGRDDQ